MKYLIIILTILLTTSCHVKNEKDTNIAEVKLNLINSIKFDGYSGIKDIDLHNGNYYLLTWGQSRIVKMGNVPMFV